MSFVAKRIHASVRAPDTRLGSWVRRSAGDQYLADISISITQRHYPPCLTPWRSAMGQLRSSLAPSVYEIWGAFLLGVDALLYDDNAA